MSVLADDNPITDECVILWTILLENFQHSKAVHSEVNSPNRPEFELIRDFMSVQVICKFHKDPIKTIQTFLQPRLNIVCFGTKGQWIPNWPELELVRDFMSVQVNFKIHKDPIKAKQADKVKYGMFAARKGNLPQSE